MLSESRPHRRLFRFLGSVQLAMILLLMGVVVMALGTILESRDGAEVARAVVYGSLWFDAYLFLIAVNLAMAVVNRIPIKRHQISFVVTHAAIILILVGAWTSRTFGYEGRLFVTEGGQSAEIILSESEVFLGGPHHAGHEHLHGVTDQAFPLPQKLSLTGVALQEENAGNPALKIVEHFPLGRVATSLVEGGHDAPPGLQLRMMSGERTSEFWLLAGSPKHERRNLGHYNVELVQADSPQELAEQLKPAPRAPVVVRIEPKSGEPVISVLLPGQLNKDVDCGDGVVARVTRYFESARVADGGIVDAPDGGPNPAVEVEVRKGDQVERHLAFGRFPDFRLHGQQETDLVESVVLEANQESGKPQLRFVMSPEGETFFMRPGAEGMQAGSPIEPGATLELDDSGLTLTLVRVLEHAAIGDTVVAATREEGGRECIRLRASLGGAVGEVWIPHGGTREILLDGRAVPVGFRFQSRPLPFAVWLEDFEIGFHPGSRQPASFSSRVSLGTLEQESASTEAVISMNRPLDYLGFRLFQSSYILGEGGRPDTTILSVSYDPGVAIVYPAFVLLILGTGWYLLKSGHRRTAKQALAQAGEARTEAIPSEQSNQAETKKPKLASSPC